MQICLSLMLIRNHSFQPNCFFHWRFKDRMLQVLINAGQQIKKGHEMTVNYMNGQMNFFFIQRYGFSSPVNPWDVIRLSGHSRIHLDSFLSIFNISGLPKEYYHNGKLSGDGDTFVDGVVIAAARILPTWLDGDIPPARMPADACRVFFNRRARSANSWYRMNRKLFIGKGCPGIGYLSRKDTVLIMDD